MEGLETFWEKFDTFRPGPAEGSRTPAEFFKKGIDPEIADITRKFNEIANKKDEIKQKLDEVYNNNQCTETESNIQLLK